LWHSVLFVGIMYDKGKRSEPCDAKRYRASARGHWEGYSI